MRYAQIRNMDIVNGEGIGVALFVQGCPFHCKNCFNSETWDFNKGKIWDNSIQNEFFLLINKPFIERISILGGEPLADQNVETIFSLVDEINKKFPNKKIWLYTGFEYDKVIKSKYDKYNDIRIKIFDKVDYIIDGQFIDELKDLNLKYRGSTNQKIIKTKKGSLT